MNNKNNQVFFDKPEKYEDIINTKYLLEDEPSVIEVENGIALPLKPIQSSVNYFQGGICDHNGVFLAGHVSNVNDKNFTHWRIFNQSYEVDYGNLNKINETVIYGGVLLPHFGHFITESFSRLWFCIQNKENYKIIFFNFENNNKIYYENILKTIGLSSKNCILITTPTQFDKIIIPEQTLYLMSGYRKECQSVYDFIISQIEPKSFKKIYLSRKKLNFCNSTREVYFEDFYRKRGFEIIYPETLSFTEQVSIINGAEEIVCTVGTLVHLTFFCKKNVKLTILGRTNNKPTNYACMFSIQMREIDAYFVDITYNFLPTDFNGCTLFIGPTKYWIEYLDKYKLSYEDDEVSFDIHVKPYIFDYLLEWARKYSNYNNYHIIRNYTLPDVIYSILETFLGAEINTEILSERDDVIKMKNYIKKDISELTGINYSEEVKNDVMQLLNNSGIQQNLQKLATQTQANFKGAQNEVLDLQNKNNILNQKCNELEKRIMELEKKISN